MAAHQCSICLKFFPDRKSLVIHLMRVHAKKPGYGKDGDDKK